ncbi:MAG TPA: protein kinase [Pirellulales bacterium]|jgi:serine/threonine protein kinase|nr:protein kinase [Pirellulales bacterium]
MALQIPDFWKLTADSRLFSPAEIARWTEAFGQVKGASKQGNAVTLAEWLIAEHALSRYQATILLAGRPGPFIYGDYKVTDRIGNGRLAGLFRAVHRPTNQDVCLYFLSGAATQDRAAVALARRQVQTAHGIHSPGLSKCYELIDLGSFKFVALEALRGETVEERLAAKGPLAPAEACRLLRLAALGLAKLHEAGQVHAAFRPSNVWVNSSGAKLLQMPLALDPFATVGPLDFAALEAAGKLEAMADGLAPELAQPGHVSTAASDIYALGCTLYQMISGKAPFAGGDWRQKVMRHTSEPIQPLTEFGAPAQLGQVVSYLMAKDPSIRYQQAGQVAEALAFFVEPSKLAVPEESASAANQAYAAYLNQRDTATPPAPAPALPKTTSAPVAAPSVANAPASRPQPAPAPARAEPGKPPAPAPAPGPAARIPAPAPVHRPQPAPAPNSAPAVQSYPGQGYAAQNYPAQNYPAQNFPAQNYPAQNYPPPGYSGQSYAPQPYPASGANPFEALQPAAPSFAGNEGALDFGPYSSGAPRDQGAAMFGPGGFAAPASNYPGFGNPAEFAGANGLAPSGFAAAPAFTAAAFPAAPAFPAVNPAPTTGLPAAGMPAGAAPAAFNGAAPAAPYALPPTIGVKKANQTLLVVAAVLTVVTVGALIAWNATRDKGESQIASNTGVGVPAVENKTPAAAPTEKTPGPAENPATPAQTSSGMGSGSPASAPPKARKQPVATSEIEDDGSTLWLAPTHGQPLELHYIAKLTNVLAVLRPADLLRHPDGEKTWAALGPVGVSMRSQLEAISGVKMADVVQLTVALYENPAGGFSPSFVLKMNDKLPGAELLKTLGNPPQKEHAGHVYFEGPTWSYYFPASEGQTVLVIADAAHMQEILDLGANPASGNLKIERMLVDSDSLRFVNLFFVPDFLFNDGRATVFSGPLQSLEKPLEAFLGSGAKAGLLSLHLTGSNFFAELRFSSAGGDPVGLAREYKEKLEKVPTDVENYLTSLNIHPYARKLLNRFPEVLRFVSDYTRAGVDDDQAVLRCQLPALAGEHIFLSGELALAQKPGQNAGGSAVASGAANPAGAGDSVAAKLKKVTTLVFPRDNLENTMKMISDDIGVPIEILGSDLQLEGITKNQSFGLEEKNKPAGEILRKVMSLANADGKLVYVVKPKAAGGPEMIFITTRASAAKRGDKLPAELEKAPPPKK